MRIEKEVKVIQVDQTCSACYVGLMRPTGMTVHSHLEHSDRWHTHACNACGHRAAYPNISPSLEYHPVEVVKVEMPKSSWKRDFYLPFISTLIGTLLVNLWYKGEQSIFAMLYRLPIEAWYILFG